MPARPQINVDIGLTAQQQVWELIEHYVEHEQRLAVQYLLQAVDEAKHRIAENPGIGAAFPKPYPTVAASGHRWFKVHRYWFAFRTAGSKATITNVFFDTADIVRRVDRS
jgi:plasmid stabilization system protein ParE